MMTDAQLTERDAQRDIGADLLASLRELKAKKIGLTTTFQPLPDGSVRRTVTLGNDTVQTHEVLVEPRWQLVAARSQSRMSQSEFAKATGVSVRTLQEREQGRKVPSGAAQSLLKLICRNPELPAELV